MVWDGGKLNAICDDNPVALWSIERPEADSLPRSKSRDRGSVHVNFPCPLREVERTSKWPRGFPREEVLRQVHECVS